MKTMKRLSLVMLAAMFTMAVNAQDIFLGGNFNFSTESSEDSFDGTTNEGPTTTRFTIMPRGGFFLSDEFALGAGIGFSSRKTTTPGDPETETKSGTFYLNPFARYYAVQSGNFSFFAEGGLSLGFGSSEQSAGGTTQDGPSTTEVLVYVRPAISYSISNSVTIEASIGSLYFASDKSEQDQGGSTATSKSNEFGLNVSPSTIIFGVIFFLP
jgi:hypothetical protein